MVAEVTASEMKPLSGYSTLINLISYRKAISETMTLTQQN